MNIYDVLKQLPLKKQMYIKWKFNLWFDSEKEVTEEELLERLNLRSLATFTRWERTEEYKHVVSVILSSKAAQDLLDVYNAVKAKVTENADAKSVDMMLKLIKEIDAHKKVADGYFNKIEDVEDDDGLEV